MTEQTPSGPPTPRGGSGKDLAALTAAIRSIERGENPAAPAPQGDPAEARRRRREAMAAEAARLQAEEAAETGTAAAGPPAVPAGATADGSPDSPDTAQGAAANEVAAGAAADTPDEPAESPGTAQDAAGRARGDADAAPPVAVAGGGHTAGGGRGRTDAARGSGVGVAAQGGGDAAGDRTAPSGRTGPGGTSEAVAQGGGDAPAERTAPSGRTGSGGTSGAAAAAADAGRGSGRPGGPGRTASTRGGASGAGAGAAGAHGDAGSAEAETATPPGGDSSAGAGARNGRTGAGGGNAAGARGERASAGPEAAAPGDSRGANGTSGPHGGSGGPAAAPVDPAAVAAAAAVLHEGGAPAELAGEAVRVLGAGAAGRLRDDPWGVLGLAGVRVEQADAFARALLGAAAGPGDERRARALVGHLMEKAAAAGHTALAADDLRAALARQAVPDPDAAVTAAVEDGLVLVFREGDEPLTDEDEDAGVRLLLGLDRYALAEESLADGCVRLLRSVEADGADWAALAAAAPSPSAAELVRAAAGSGLVLHTGGEAARAEPAALVAAARGAGLRAYAAAYTPDGRRRLAAAVGQDAAVTVEGLLAGREGPGRGAAGALELDLLAVLDAQQLSVVEGADLVEALADGTRLVLSGDPGALWSTGPGRAFADLLAAKVCPRVASRTPDPGPIGELLSCVAAGELAAVDAPDKEVVVVPVRDPREAVHRTVQLVADSVPRAIGVPAERTQVVAFAHSGPVGTRALNAALKERLNPGPGRFGGFDPGDRAVYVPAPGRALYGTVAGAEPGGLRLECEQGPVLVPRADVAGAVRHGWAVTAHQAAGTRWPAAVVVVPGDAGPLLTRGWVYTAFGRGERHLSVVQGADQALAAAVAGPAARPRTTRLVAVLRELTADG